jgi:hypothetical protein
MYLHCHKCGWEQDDFWEPGGWSPLRESDINELRDALFKNVILLDGGKTIMDSREFVAENLRSIISKIEGMKWRTFEEWKNLPKEQKICPKCGSTSDWDID